MNENLKHTLKIWLTTAFAAPLILIVIDYLSTPSSFYSIGEAISAYFIAIIAGILFSSITWLLFLTCVYNLSKIYLPETLYRPIIQITGLLLAFLTFFVLVALKDSEVTIIATRFFWETTSPYLICLFLSIQFYQLPQLYIHQQQNSTT